MYTWYKYSGVPYITIHAQRKARAIVKLVQSIELTNELFLDSTTDGDVNGGKQENAEDDDDIDSDDEMDDEGEEVVVEGIGPFCALKRMLVIFRKLGGKIQFALKSTQKLASPRPIFISELG